MSEATLRLKSVKYDDGAIEIVAVETHQATSDEKEIRLSSTEEPRPEFLEPFVELRQHVRNLIEVGREWAADELQIKKVVWSYSENTGVRGATICCQAKLACADSPLVFNTPHLPFDQYSEGGNAPLMPSAIQVVLGMLEAEAQLFLDGKRAQADLFDSEPAQRLRESIAKGEVSIEGREMSLQLSIRGDLLRAALRFATRVDGVRVEPAHNGGAVIAAWSDDCGLFVHDASAIALRPAQILLPPEFVDTLAKSVRTAQPGEVRALAASDGSLSLGGLVAANAVIAPKASPWRAETARHGITRMKGRAFIFRRDVMDSVGEAARMLARAAGASAHESERAEYVLHSGADGTLVTTFPAFGDDKAFALIARTDPPPDQAWAWTPPTWLAEPMPVSTVEAVA